MAEPSPPRHAEFEAKVVADFDDLESWRKWASWLRERGEAMGERLPLAIDRATFGHGADDKLATFADDHRQRWVGRELGALLDHPAFASVAMLDWRYGFIVGVYFDQLSFDLELDAHAPGPDRLLRELVTAPVSRLLRRLRLDVVDFEGLVDEDYAPFFASPIEVFAGIGPCPSVRELTVGAPAEVDRMPVGEVPAILRFFPELESLEVYDEVLELGGCYQHPQLRSLLVIAETIAGPLSLRRLAESRLPALERLEIDLATPSLWRPLSPRLDELEALWTGEGLGQLRHLGIRLSNLGNSLAAGLVESALLPRLRVVELCSTGLGLGGARLLLRHADRLAHLERLDLRGERLPAELADELKGAIPGVLL